ncbi:MAG: hypothetical protein EPO20_10175 [Betaproteobacteria bacterium]|nr:MAG: hypothetical protein EPO20_10175 [Betaproteobacteria bacterium]
MTDQRDLLSDEEIQKIARLVQILDRSTFDFLQIRAGQMQVTIGKGTMPATLDVAAPEADVAEQTGGSTPALADGIAHGVQEKAPADGLLDVKAPMVGRFYTRPEPKAPPFVSVGSEVTAESTVGLIEVMKVFTAVPAAASGVIVEICAKDEQFVEYGAVLMRVRPSR